MTNSSFNRLTRGRIDGLTSRFPNGTSPRLSWGLLLCLLLGHSATALAAELTNTPPAEVPVVQTDSIANAQQQLANYSDQQIGVMLQRWPQLDAAQRRDLLAEVRKRMRQATAVNASKETAKTRSSGPSLTLRIKRAPKCPQLWPPRRTPALTGDDPGHNPAPRPAATRRSNPHYGDTNFT